MNKKDSKEKIDKIINNETHILVGTQLISKGFHFPSLNCIVVVDIDLSSQGHDLRGAEKNLQLYHQLSGRAGRTGKPATVYFQTYENNTKMISEITSKNPDIFLERELQIRKKNKLPPFQRFISLILTGDNEIKLEKEAINFKNFIENKIEGKILGPVNAPLFRLKRKFRIRFLIRGYEGCELINEIKPFDKDLILDKTEHSCFVNTNLQNYLKEKNINNLIICGVTTQCCVLSTYRHSLDLGMDSLLIEDCCGAYDTKIHQSAINIINSEDGVLGKTLTLKELIN